MAESCDPISDEERVEIALHVDEESQYVRLELKTKQEEEVATTDNVDESKMPTVEAIEKQISDSALQKTVCLDKNSPLPAHSIEIEKEATEGFNCVSCCPGCGSHLPSTTQSLNPTNAFFEKTKIKNSEKAVEDSFDRAYLRRQRRLSDNKHRFSRSFFEDSRAETLQNVRDVAVNGAEAMKNRLRLSVLRENETRMDAEMARAEIETSRVEKALAEILLEDTKHHENTLQRDLQNAVTELQEVSMECGYKERSSGYSLRDEVRSLTQALDNERRQRAYSTAETNKLLKQFKEMKQTKSHLIRLENEVRRVNEKLQKFEHQYSIRVEDRQDNGASDCWYHTKGQRVPELVCPKKKTETRIGSIGKYGRSISCRHRQRLPTDIEQNVNISPNTGFHKRSGTGSAEDDDTGIQDYDFKKSLDEMRQSPTTPQRVNRRDAYIPPIPPTKVDLEDLKKARQDYMIETKRMQDRWQEISRNQ